MTQRPGDDDPWELDPFGDQEYDPAIAFAFVAARQAAEKVADAGALFAVHTASYDGHTNAIAVSACKSAHVQLSDLRKLSAEIDAHEQRARAAPPRSSEQISYVNQTVETFNVFIAAYDQFGITIGYIATPDIARTPVVKPPLPPIQDPIQASNQIEADLKQWVQARRQNDKGELVVVTATPGVGKTRAMLRVAIEEQKQRQRVTYSVRTKDALIGDNPEMVQRAHATSPIGQVHLAVLTGRGPENCWAWPNVQAVQAHGYAPGQAVCPKCEYYPDNALALGLSICPYYEQRIRAHNLSRGARVGQHHHYPLIFTTHASIVAWHSGGSGRWNAHCSTDLLILDEDPTDALETDLHLLEAQAAFYSNEPHNRAASVASSLFQKAIEIGKQERVQVASNHFRDASKTEPNTHPVHSRYDSAYAGNQLHELLERARSTLNATMGMPQLTQVLRDVAEAQSFSVQPGALAGVQSVSDINALHIPPRALGQVAENVHRELNHAIGLRRIIYEEIRGRPSQGESLSEILAALATETEVAPLSYISRLECLPADLAKGRERDEWRFVVRDIEEFPNRTATLVVGDAYAQKEHYEQIFNRDAHIINRVSMLHADTYITRVIDDHCNIGSLRKGGLQRVLALLETFMPANVRGERVLIYGHQELRPRVEAWMEDVAEKLGVAEWAYEHWWGGRGKDQYNGWEHTYCISDPVQSLSGIKHVVNARAFRDSLRAKDREEKLRHGRKIGIETNKHGLIHALSSGDTRLTLEHERQNVAELTQAMHRGRPVHHGVNVTVFGEMEQSRDLVAQTDTIVLDDSRKERVSAARRSHSPAGRRASQVVGTIDAFATPKEVWRAVEAIIDWYGVFSPLFAHSLLTSTNVGSVVYYIDPLRRDDGPDPPIGLRIHPQLHLLPAAQPDADAPTVDPRLQAPLEAAPRMGTVIDRVWHPPVYWQLLTAKESLPKAVREALLKLPDNYEKFKSTRWATWQEKFKTVRGGPRPMIYFEPSTSPQEALALFYEIVDHQYGPVVNGKLYRPSARMELPVMRWKDVPF